MRRALAAVVVVAMGFFLSCRARRDDRSNRYGPETTYEGAVSTLPTGIGGGPRPSAPVSVWIPISASPSSVGSCVVPPSIRPSLPATLGPNAIPPRPSPAQKPRG